MTHPPYFFCGTLHCFHRQSYLFREKIRSRSGHPSFGSLHFWGYRIFQLEFDGFVNRQFSGSTKEMVKPHNKGDFLAWATA